MKKSVVWLGLVTAVLAAQAQVADQVRRATISGSQGTSGKCTIEVRVDTPVEVDVYGDSRRLRTIAGQPATWTRLECTDPLPYSMSDFKFKGIDGRGNVKLAQHPRNNNSMAVVRIDDPKVGSENYTFEIEWSGASGGAPTGGFASSGYSVLAPDTPASPGVGRSDVLSPGRIGYRNLSAERALDLCRTEVHTRAERDTSHGLVSGGPGSWTDHVRARRHPASCGLPPVQKRLGRSIKLRHIRKQRHCRSGSLGPASEARCMVTVGGPGPGIVVAAFNKEKSEEGL